MEVMAPALQWCPSDAEDASPIEKVQRFEFSGIKLSFVLLSRPLSILMDSRRVFNGRPAQKGEASHGITRICVEGQHSGLTLHARLLQRPDLLRPKWAKQF